MKKLVFRFVVLALMMTMYFPLSTHAQTISVIIDGQPQSFDQNPIIKEGRVLVPLRGIFETLGAEVIWDGKEKAIRATYKRHTLDLTVGSKQIVLDNKGVISIDVEPQLINNRTMIPLRVISEWAGSHVEWDQRNKVVTIQKVETLGYHWSGLNAEGFYQADLNEIDNDEAINAFADFVISKGYPVEKEELIRLINEHDSIWEDHYRFYEIVPPASSYTWMRVEWK